VVIAIIGILATLLAGGISAGMNAAHAGACKSNLRQLGMANTVYAADNKDHFVAAAADLMGSNTQRWHGRRDSRKSPFDGARGPLVAYLEDQSQLRRCGALEAVRQSAAENAFEASCGGYGYNAIGIGSMAYINGYNAKSAQTGLRAALLSHPFGTIMFADTAFPQPYRNPEFLIEYSFTEPVFFLGWNSTEENSRRATASIHFRHNRQTAQFCWADGHVDARPRGVPATGGGDKFAMGWPGEENNDLFRP
jgi:prepilin-type processing-associated H-X9-DG protein